MALTDANPAFGPTEQGIMLEMNEMDRFGSIWIDSDTFENLRFSILANPSSAAQKSGFWSSGNWKSEIFQVPKMTQKRHFWIAELQSFKMR